MSSRSWVVSSTVVPCARVEVGEERADAVLAHDVEADRSARRGRAARGRGAARRSARRACADRARAGGPASSRNSSSSSSSMHSSSRSRCGAAVDAGRCGAAASNDSASGRSHHSSERCPNTTPMRRASCDALARRHQPGDLHLGPRVGTSTPVSILIVVDLPAPFGPDVAEHLARVDAERHAVDRFDHGALAAERGRACATP